MYSLKDLDAEIATEVDRMVTNGETPKEWVISGVMGNHTDLSGEDVSMALCCMRETVADRTNRYFRALKISEADTPQIPLPGFERLQRRYVIKRNKQQTIVSVYDMTYDELTSKAAEMATMAEGCLQHEAELLKFRDERQSEDEAEDEA